MSVSEEEEVVSAEEEEEEEQEVRFTPIARTRAENDALSHACINCRFAGAWICGGCRAPPSSVQRAERNQRLLESKARCGDTSKKAPPPQDKQQQKKRSGPNSEADALLRHKFIGVETREQAEAVLEASKAMVKIQRVAAGLNTHHDLYKAAATVAIARKALENLLATSPDHYITIEGYTSKTEPGSRRRITSVDKALRVFAKYDRDDNVEKPFLVRLFNGATEVPTEDGWVYLDMHVNDLNCVIAEDSNLDSHLQSAEAIVDMIQPS